MDARPRLLHEITGRSSDVTHLNSKDVEDRTTSQYNKMCNVTKAIRIVAMDVLHTSRDMLTLKWTKITYIFL